MKVFASAALGAVSDKSLLLMSIPSVLERHPGEFRTPDAHPANEKFVPFATSEFHGGPTGVDEGSGLKTKLVKVAVTVPADPVFIDPIGVAHAFEANSRTSTA